MMITAIMIAMATAPPDAAATIIVKSLLAVLSVELLLAVLPPITVKSVVPPDTVMVVAALVLLVGEVLLASSGVTEEVPSEPVATNSLKISCDKVWYTGYT